MWSIQSGWLCRPNACAKYRSYCRPWLRQPRRSPCEPSKGELHDPSVLKIYWVFDAHFPGFARTTRASQVRALRFKVIQELTLERTIRYRRTNLVCLQNLSRRGLPTCAGGWTTQGCRAGHAAAVSRRSGTQAGRGTLFVAVSSPRATTTAVARSPVTLSAVRHMSRKRSTPRMIAIPSGGTPR